jgi:hypothetical protein
VSGIRSFLRVFQTAIAETRDRSVSFRSRRHPLHTHDIRESCNRCFLASFVQTKKVGVKIFPRQRQQRQQVPCSCNFHLRDIIISFCVSTFDLARALWSPFSGSALRFSSANNRKVQTFFERSVPSRPAAVCEDQCTSDPQCLGIYYFIFGRCYFSISHGSRSLLSLNGCVSAPLPKFLPSSDADQ